MKKRIIPTLLSTFFLIMAFSTFANSQSVSIYGYSVILWDDAAPQRVSGLAGTAISYHEYYSPNQTGVLTLSPSGGTPLEINRFEGGRFAVGIKSFRVESNTADTVTVRNMTSGSITITNGSQFQLYDDDDMDDEDVASLNGDQGDNVPEPPDSLIINTDAPCSSSLTANCNTFAPAFVRPAYDLSGSGEVTVYEANINVSVDPLDPNATVPPTEIQAKFDFDNFINEANADFWTVYLNGVYQYDERRDGDPASNLSILGTVDTLNGQGALMFSEVTRSHEIPNFAGRPVGRAFTVVHEIGHLFFGTHSDLGLMEVTGTRTIGTFDDRTLNKIRGGEFTFLGVTRRIAHP